MKKMKWISAIIAMAAMLIGTAYAAPSAEHGLSKLAIGMSAEVGMYTITNEGSGLGSCERDLKKLCLGAVFGKGLAGHGADAAKSESMVAAWAKRAI